jgi:hypothetical protein
VRAGERAGGVFTRQLPDSNCPTNRQRNGQSSSLSVQHSFPDALLLLLQRERASRVLWGFRGSERWFACERATAHRIWWFLIPSSMMGPLASCLSALLRTKPSELYLCRWAHPQLCFRRECHRSQICRQSAPGSARKDRAGRFRLTSKRRPGQYRPAGLLIGQSRAGTHTVRRRQDRSARRCRNRQCQGRTWPHETG